MGDRDIRRSPSSANKPYPVKCINDLSIGGYACSVRITLPEPVGGGARTAFLNLSSLYGKTSYRVTLYDGSQAVAFDAVQPEVDATGRASDLFRRVKSRIELFPVTYNPVGAIDITGSLCKSFLVADTEADFQWIGACDPVVRP